MSFMFKSIVIAVLCALQVSSFVHGLREMAVSTNCSAGTVPCGGPVPVCCPSGSKCNFGRGIPICENPKNAYSGGYGHEPCNDPYLNSCDLIGIVGFCCPIGTMCFNDGVSRTVDCIDAHGTTATSFPSSTTGIVPSATPIPASDTRIVYSPSDAWNISSTNANCTSSNVLYTTDTLNASISFNYSGPSIEVYVITASNGGVFRVYVDGFNTTSTIDTFTGSGQSLPLCYPHQFPPVAIAPPHFGSQDSHTLTLVYIGPSVDAPVNTSTSIGQFNSFAIPDFVSTTTKNQAISSSVDIYVYAFSILIALMFIT